MNGTRTALAREVVSDAELAEALKLSGKRVRGLFRRGIVPARRVASGLLGAGRFETTWSALESAVRLRQEQTLDLLMAFHDESTCASSRCRPGLQSVVIEPWLGGMPPYLRALRWGVVNDLAPEMPAGGLVAGVATFRGLPFMLWLTLRGARASGAGAAEFSVVGDDLIRVFCLGEDKAPLGRQYDAGGNPFEPGVMRDRHLLFANGLHLLLGALGRDGRRAPEREVMVARAGGSLRLRMRVRDAASFRLEIA